MTRTNGFRFTRRARHVRNACRASSGAWAARCAHQRELVTATVGTLIANALSTPIRAGMVGDSTRENANVFASTDGTAQSVKTNAKTFLGPNTAKSTSERTASGTGDGTTSRSCRTRRGIPTSRNNAAKRAIDAVRIME